MDGFLKQYEVTDKSIMTHTSIKPARAYYIPVDAIDRFHQLYAITLLNGKQLHITETHRDIGPIVIDLDFRQDSKERVYTHTMIIGVIKCLYGVMCEFLEIPRGTLVVVQEKPLRPHGKHPDMYKDGVHLIFPNIVTKPDFQQYMRRETLKPIAELFDDLRFLNSIDDIYDANVIKGNWLMYGSNKPSEKHRWVVTKIYRVATQECSNASRVEDNYSFEQLDLEGFDFDTLVDLLSIRNKYDETPYKPGKILPPAPDVDIPDSVSTTTTSFTTSSNYTVEHDYITKLVGILTPKRADNYQTWMRVGWCLHNIEPSNLMLGLWIEFSQKSPKYTRGECEKLWNGMWANNTNGLRLGSLCTWAKEDDPKAFYAATEKSINYLVTKSLSGTHTEMARVVHRKYRDAFVCASIDKHIWYEYRNHRWIKIENAYSLRQLISDDIVSLYVDHAKRLKVRAMSCESEDDQKQYLTQSSKMTVLASKLMMASFKEGIMKECAEMFYDPDFLEKLNSNPKLIGFANGVYDLETHKFRNGNPNDYLTMSTGYELVSENIPEVVDDIMDFMKDIMKNDDMKQYILKVLAYMLDGDKYLEQLWFFTGKGRNGKGTLCTLLKSTLGDYYYEPDITIVTTSKKSSSNANPEIVKAVGKRLLVASEPDDSDKDAKFRVNKLKQLRGNDLIQARGLYKDCIEFKPQFGMIFQMNDKPELTKVDDAIAKTLKIVEFPWQFVMNPKSDCCQRQMKTSLKNKFEHDMRYKQQFMLILLEYHKRYIDGNQLLEDPQDVKDATTEYMESNNPCVEWLDKYYTITSDKTKKHTPLELRLHFERDMRNKITKDAFSKYMAAFGVSPTKSNGTLYYYGLTRTYQGQDDDEPNDDL